MHKLNGFWKLHPLVWVSFPRWNISKTKHEQGTTLSFCFPAQNRCHPYFAVWCWSAGGAYPPSPVVVIILSNLIQVSSNPYHFRNKVNFSLLLPGANKLYNYTHFKSPNRGRPSTWSWVKSVCACACMCMCLCIPECILQQPGVCTAESNLPSTKVWTWRTWERPTVFLTVVTGDFILEIDKFLHGLLF